MRSLILHDNEPKYCYYIADSYYQSDIQINGLEHFRQVHSNSIELSNKKPNLSSKSNEIFHQLTPIGEKTYPIRVTHYEDNNYRLTIHNDKYFIQKKSIHADIKNIDITVLLGPVFILHLAQNSVFCLHASAFLIDDTCFILMADSGTGKSTIAKHINAQKIGSRIADDIVALKFINNKLTLLPNFPQLKLDQDQQYQGETLNKKTILLFAKKSKSNTSLKKIKQFSAIKNLIKHSVATKLFAQNELKNHLNFCHQTGTEKQAYQLNYQHSQDGLKRLLKKIHELL